MGELQNPRARDRDPYRELFERSADAILIIEGETFIDCNEAAVTMLRYSNREEVLQTHPSELSPPRQPDGRASFEKANEMISIAFAQGSHRFEWEHRRADGEVFPVEVLLTAVQEVDRHVLHVVWRDITERKGLEDQLRQAQKMEAIGKLTGGIAHDFNNLLVTVIGHSDLLVGILEDNEEAAQHVHEIRRAGKRAAELVRQLLAFGRRQQLMPVSLDLNALARDMQRLLERLIGADVALTVQLERDPLPIKADRTQIEQLLLNLAANARDAMPRGGRLTISTARLELSSTKAEQAPGLPEGEYVRLSVADSGVGMDAETVSQAFDPFFTTKPPGKGTGLGLATVYGIVQQTGGTVRLQSTPGRGTNVEILLPLTREPIARDEPAPEPKPGSLGGSETLLVVEDDPAVSALVVDVLTSRGYRVLVGRDGSEALSLYAAHADEVQLVLTDVIMPTMSGPQLVSALDQLGFEPNVLFMSGYTDGDLTSLREVERRVELLQKPFSSDELLEQVRTVLDRARERAANRPV